MKKLLVSLIILIIGITIMAVVAVKAQQPVATFKLNPEASKRFVELSASWSQTYSKCKDALDARVNEQQGILLGAGVPAEMRTNCDVDATGIVVCKKPEAAKAASDKAKP